MAASINTANINVKDEHNQSTRYETLLQQIVQLNRDLQKTVALSQTLQTERDILQNQNKQLQDEIKHIDERCDKLQLLLVQEAEYKVELQQQHEEILAKWKRQLDAKAREFDALQQKLAPPCNLDELRQKLQDELEGPHRQRLAAVQDEIDKHRTIAFNYRREYEILKAQLEQITMDQNNEIECLHACYTKKIASLSSKLEISQEKVRDTNNIESIRKLEQEKAVLSIELRILQEEVQSVRDEMKRTNTNLIAQKGEHERVFTDLATKNSILELDQKAMTRKMDQLVDELQDSNGKNEKYMTQILHLTTDCEQLRSQIKEKEILLLNTQTIESTKLRDEKEIWEREDAKTKEQVNDLLIKLQTAEALLQHHVKNEKQLKAYEEKLLQSERLIQSKKNEIQNLEAIKQQREKRIEELELQLQKQQIEANEKIQNLQRELEATKKSYDKVIIDQEHLNTQRTSTQELVMRIKSECVMLRAKLKDLETEYRELQVKHRDLLQNQDDMQLEKNQVNAKLKYLENDYEAMIEKLRVEREQNESRTRDFMKQCNEIKTSAHRQQDMLQNEMQLSIQKLTKELTSTQKKRDSYKQKCLEVHERYKVLHETCNDLNGKISQLQDTHTQEIQQLVTHVTHLENEKTTILQRQLEKNCS